MSKDTLIIDSIPTISLVETPIVEQGHKVLYGETPVTQESYDLFLSEMRGILESDDPVATFAATCPDSELGDLPEQAYIEIGWFHREIREALLKSDLFEYGRKPAGWVSYPSAALFCNLMSRRNGAPVPYKLKGKSASGALANKTWLKYQGGKEPTHERHNYFAVIAIEPREYAPNQIRLPNKEVFKAALSTYGKNLRDFFWDASQDTDATMEVGLKSASSCGIYDLVGNTKTWIEDSEGAGTLAE